MNNDFLEEPIQRQLTPAAIGVPLAQFTGIAPKTGADRINQDSHPLPSNVAKRIILLVTQDTKLDQGLRTAAKGVGHIIIRVDCLSDALRTVRANCAHVALFDIDMSAEMGWAAAEGLMEDPKCPPVILLTGRTQQFDMRMAIQGGVLLDKTADPDCILQAAYKILEAPSAAAEERNGIQRALIRWLRPLHWPSQPVATRRVWGINE